MDRDWLYKKIEKRIRIFNRDLFLEIVICTLTFIGGYWFIICPLELIDDISKKIRQEISKKESLEIRIEELKLQNSLIQTSLDKENLKTEVTKEFLYKLITENNLNILKITLIEKKEKQYNYIYSLEGNEEDFLKFLKQIN